MKGVNRLIVTFLIGILFLTGCGSHKPDTEMPEEAEEMEFEIVTGSDVPYKVNEKIFRSKEKGFGFVYRDGECMYAAFGFGKRNTGGYSIRVLTVRQTDIAVMIEAQLVEPEEGEVISADPSYPYMILKMDNVDKDTQFLLR